MSVNKLREACLAAAAVVVVACGSNGAASPAVSVPIATSSPAQSATPPPPVASATATAIATASTQPTRNPSAGYTDLKGWIVFEHFGQAPDGSTPDLDFDNRMIWMVHADGTGLHELSPNAPNGGKSSPDISPDGHTVAFNTWSEPVQIWTVPIEGGQPTLVTTNCDGSEERCIEGEPNYSGDGKKLAFSRQWVENGATWTAIGIRDLASGHVTLLDSTKVDGSLGYVTQPSLSPDGGQVAYYTVALLPSQDRPTGTQIMVATTDGSSVRELPRLPGSAWAADPDWSPDGKSIVFAGVPSRESEGWGDFPNQDGISTINPDGTNLVNICKRCLLTPLGPGSGNAPSWASDGRILFWGYKSWALMNADGSDAAHINMAKLTWNGDGLGYNYSAFLQPTN